MKLKLFLISILFIIASSSTFAQTESRYFKQGYMGNVELGVGADVAEDRNAAVSILTSHGYVFGKGVYLGFGAGIQPSLYKWGDFSIPVFTDFKYSPINGVVSPFIGMSLGMHYYTSCGLFVSPNVGINIGRWSIFMRYTYREFDYYELINHTNVFNRHIANHLITFNVAFSF